MSDSSRPRVTIYTDGGADPNPGPGGWGAVLLRTGPGGEVEGRELSGHEPRATNNRMELTAAIRALESLPEASRVELFTDSAYLRKGVSEWLPGWIARGWRRQTGELQNEDLWRRLASAAADHEVTWHWVKGHAGNRWNERADRLATEAMRRQRAEAVAARGRGEGAGGRGADHEAGDADPAPRAPEFEIYLRVAYPPGGRGGWAALLRRTGAGGAESADGPNGSLDGRSVGGGEGAAERGERSAGEAEPGTADGEVLTGTAAVPSANALDLVAAIAALERVPPGAVVAVHSGSDYLRNGARLWLPAWKRAGWKTREGSPVKNRELWQRLDSLLAACRVLWPDLDPAARAELDRLAPLARAALGGPRTV
jgi:ribonuclease HI